MKQSRFLILVVTAILALMFAKAEASGSNFSGESLQQTPISILSGGTGSIDIPFVDAEKLRTAWLSWHNEERVEKGLVPYRYHGDLERTGTAWSKSLAEKYTAHRREWLTGYYNYYGIMKWFADRDVTFETMTGKRSSFSESIGYRYFKCTSGDCTDKAIKATRKIFDSYLKEGVNGVHYRAIVMPHFTQMGVGFAVNPQNNMIYATIHYGVELKNTL